MKARLGFIVWWITSACCAVAVDFTGTYKGESEGEAVTVTLLQEGTKVTGDGKEGDLSWTFDLEAKGDMATGTASGTVMGSKFVLYARLTLKGDSLKLDVSTSATMDDAESMNLKRVVSAVEPNAAPKGVKGAIFKKGASDTLKNGQEYTHASGGKFRYPKGWRVEISEELEMLRLLPPDATANELYGFMSAPADGQKDPMSAAVISSIDEGVLAMFPMARKVGKPIAITSGLGKASLVIYEATVDGVASQLRCYITIYKDTGVVLVAAGPKATVEKRDSTMREIFSTMGWGQGKVDSTLVGTWMHYGYVGSGATGRETKMIVVLKADGSFSYSSDSEFSSTMTGRDGGGNDAWSGVAYGRSGSGWSGRWTAGDGTLILHFEDGTSESFTYRLEMQGSLPVMKVTPADGGKTLEWSKQN